MAEAYRRIKGLIGEDSQNRLGFVQQEVEKMGIVPNIQTTINDHHSEKHLVTKVGKGDQKEIWLSANYDTVGHFPSANNNGSGVVALLGLTELLNDSPLNIDARIVYFDGGLDPDLVNKKRRNPEFKPGSERYMDYMMNEELEFIEPYDGAIVVQAVGKGDLVIFEKTGRKTENSKRLNSVVLETGKSLNIPIKVEPNSPNADNISFAKHGLEATVLARYHEGSWHRMQSREDGLSNVNPHTIDVTTEFLYNLLKEFAKKAI